MESDNGRLGSSLQGISAYGSPLMHADISIFSNGKWNIIGRSGSDGSFIIPPNDNIELPALLRAQLTSEMQLEMIEASENTEEALSGNIQTITYYGIILSGNQRQVSITPWSTAALSNAVGQHIATLSDAEVELIYPSGFLIRFFLDLDDLGIYGITYKLGLPIFFVVKAFRSAWAPAVLDETDDENTEDDTRQMCARVTTYFTLFGIFGCLILATFAREIIVLIAGDNAETYLEGIRVVPLVGLAFFFHGLYIILTAGVYAEGRAGSLPFIVGTGACVNIAINIFLLPKIGFIAAAYSTLIAHVLMAVLLYLIVRRFYPVPYEYGRLGKICIAGAVVFVVLSPHLHDTSIEGVIARVIFVAGYPLILWGWRFFTP